MKLALFGLGILLSQHLVFGQMFVAWGDSLTAGFGGVPWPSQFTSLTGTPMLNRGISGETSSQIRARFLAEPALFDDRVVIWAGRNNYSQPGVVQADIALMVSALTTSDYLVLGVINGNFGAHEALGGAGYAAITGLNASLSLTYGSRFIDIRTLLVNAYDPLSAQDVSDFAADIVPASLRNDALHLNSAGYAIVAAAVDAGFTAIPEPAAAALLFACGSALAAGALRRQNG